MRAIGVLCALLCGCGDAGDPVVEPLTVSWLRVLGNQVSVHEPHPFVFDRDDNFVFALHTFADPCFELRKLGPDGAELWRKPFSDPPPDPYRCPLEASPAVDAQGNIFALGHSISSSSDIFLRKHGPQGDVIWTRYHDGDAGGLDLGDAVATDRAGNVIAGGAEATGAPLHSYSPWLAKYSPDGLPLWLYRPDSLLGHWTAVGTDGADNVLAVRYMEDHDGSSLGRELHKVAPDGTPIWSVTLSPESDRRTPLAVHPDGWSVVALASDQLIGFDADGRTAFEIEVPRDLQTIDGIAGGASVWHVAIAADGTIAVSSNVVFEPGEDSFSHYPALLLSRYTPQGALTSMGLIERRSKASRQLTLDSLAFDSRGRLAFTGDEDGEAFVAAIDPE
jgi:hypothetical protein